MPCWEPRFVPWKNVAWLFAKYPEVENCLIGFYHIRGKRYDEINPHRGTRRSAYDGDRVLALYRQFKWLFPQERQDLHDALVPNVNELTIALMQCETFFQQLHFAEEQERVSTRRELIRYLEERAAEMEYPLVAWQLHSCLSFKKVVSRPQHVGHDVVWNRIVGKIQRERPNRIHVLLGISDVNEEAESDEGMDEGEPTTAPVGGFVPLTAPVAVMVPRPETEHTSSVEDDNMLPSVMTPSDAGPTFSDEFMASLDPALFSSDAVMASSDAVTTSSDTFMISSDGFMTSSDDVMVFPDADMASSDAEQGPTERDGSSGPGIGCAKPATETYPDQSVHNVQGRNQYHY